MIASSENEKIKRLRKLIAKKSARDEENVFVIEGKKQIAEAPRELLCEVYISSDEEDLKTEWYSSENVTCMNGISVYEVERELFARVSDTKTPQGIMAVVKKPSWPKFDAKEDGLYLICERLQDPGNVGTIIRTSEAAGADAVILSKDCADIFSPKVSRATMGSIFRQPVYYAEDIIAFTEDLCKEGVAVYAADLLAKDNYFDKDYKKASAFLIGNEGAGLSDEIKQVASEGIKIPMSEKIDSLNAAMSAGILLYEAVRQRK